MAVTTKPLLALAIEFIERYNSDERESILLEASTQGTYKGRNVYALISTLYPYYDRYQSKGLEDSLNYLSTGSGLNKAREKLHHIQTKPEETYDRSSPPEPQGQDFIENTLDKQSRAFKINASKEIAKDKSLEKEGNALHSELEEAQKINEEVKVDETGTDVNKTEENQDQAKIDSIKSRLEEIKGKRLSPAQRLLYGSVETHTKFQKLNRQVNQYSGEGDLVDQTLDIIQHNAQKELEHRGRQILDRQLTKMFGPRLRVNIPSGKEGGVNIPSPISNLASSAVQNTTSNIIRGIGSKTASIAAQTAARAAAGVAAGASAPVSVVGIIIAVVIIIILVIFFYFYQNTFAPYNPVPIPEDASAIVAPPQGLLPPSSFTGDICPIPSKNITCTSFYDSRPGMTCHHCDASYVSIDSEHAYNCSNFHGTFYAIDIADSKGAYIYLPTIAGDKIQWTFRGTEYIDQQIQKYTGVDEKTGAQYYLQLHHTLNGSGNPGTHESGEPGGRICTGSDCNHVHVQIGSGGSGPGDTIWLDSAAYMCK